MRRPLQLIVITLLCVLASAVRSETEPCARPFDDASIVPADVSLYLQIEDAAKLRRELDGWPAGGWIMRLLKGEQVAGVWAGLCDRLKADEPAVFDMLFGRRCTLVIRKMPAAANANGAHDAAAQASQWAVILHMPETESRNLISRLRSATPWPLAGVNISRIPEQRMLVARVDDRFIAGPSDQPGLFNDIIRRLGLAEQNVEQSLADTPTFEQTRTLGGGQVSVYTTNPASTGGHSYITARLFRGRVYLRQLGTFDRSPFSRPPTDVQIDTTPLRAVERGALAAFIEPIDIGDTSIERFLGASFGTGLLNEAMRKSLGDRRLVVIGEEEGRMRDNPEDILAPTVSLVYQCADDDIPARTILDRHAPALASGFAERLNGLAGAPKVDVRWKAGDPRQIDLSPAARNFTGDLPIFNSLVLSWAVAQSETSRWYLMGTNPTQVNEIHDALEAAPDRGRTRRIDNAGALNGVRLARHLSSWADRADEIAVQGKEAQFRESVVFLSGLLESMNLVRWRMRRPTRDSMQLDMEIELAPPHSDES